MARLALAGGTPLSHHFFPALVRLRRARTRPPPRGAGGPQLGGYPSPKAMVERFGAAFAAAHDARHAFAVANGMVAIEIAPVAAGRRSGDEVIVPAYTFEASAAPVLRPGAVPVFADVLPETYRLDPAATTAAITPRTRALLPVHLAMCLADFDELAALARKHGLRVVEDCAHAHGDGLFYEPHQPQHPFDVEPADFPALGERLPWETTRCPVAETAAFEEPVWLPHRLLLGTEKDVDTVLEAIANIRANVDELRTAEHRLVSLKSMSRAHRNRAVREGL
jgi:hypothetical protein